MSRAPLGCFVLALCLGSTQGAQAHGGLQGTAAALTEVSVLVADAPGPELQLLSSVSFAGAAPGQPLFWVIPTPGTPEVAVSTGTALARLDASTAPQYWRERLPRDGDGAPCVTPGAELPVSPEFGPDGADGVGRVRAFDVDSVPPHQTLVLAAPPAASDAAAALGQLDAAGIDSTDWDREVLAGYLGRGFDLVVIEYRPEVSQGRLRPVLLRYEADGLQLPTFVAATGQASPLSLRVWVVGPTQGVPLNLPSVILSDARLDWLSARPIGERTLPDGGGGPIGDGGYRPDNYDRVVLAAAQEAGGVGVITELAGPASQHRERVWWGLDDERWASLSEAPDGDGLEVVREALSNYDGSDGLRTAVADHVTLPQGTTLDAFMADPGASGDGIEVDVAGFIDALDRGVVGPLRAAGALLQAGPYLTRLFARFAPPDLGADLTLGFNYDLAQVEHVRVARQVTGCAAEEAGEPYRMTTPQGAVVVGTGGAWPGEAALGPASLKVVELGTSGAGAVIVDNGGPVTTALEGLGGEVVRPAVQSPADGVPIGGGQLLAGPMPAGPMPAGPMGAEGTPVGPIGTSTEDPPTVAAPDPSVATPDSAIPPPGPGPVPTASRGRGCAVSQAARAAGTGAWVWAVLGLLLLRRLGARSSALVWLERISKKPGCSSCVLGCLVLVLTAGCHGAPDMSAGSAMPQANPPTASAGMSGSPPPSPAAEILSPEQARELEHLQQLRDPMTCQECHPRHYREWSGSMHAYAAVDPVFIAMNQRGQRETNGELGDFCVQCHAPMAVFDGLTQDGLNLDELPDRTRGVSCYYCHNTEAIEGDHNGQLRIANDTVMRGPFDDPIESTMHGAVYSPMFDEGEALASDTCGACHDIVTPSGVRLERTYREYLTSVFAKVVAGDPRPFESCLSCHMNPRTDVVSTVEGSPERLVHEHFWPAVDLATVDFPHREAMRSAVEDCQLGQGVSLFTLEVTPPDLFTFQIETGAGHNQPSGSALDRRLWLEFLAYDDQGELLPASSGNIADDGLEEYPADDPRHDPNLLMLRDRIFDAEGKPVHMFWEAAPSADYPDGYLSQTIPPAKTTYLRGQNTIVKQYRAQTPDGRLPARVTARIRLRPIGRDVLQDLVDSGDLAEEIRDAMQTLTLSKQIAWTRQDGAPLVVTPDSESHDCTSYLCLLHPGSDDCP